MSIIIRCHLEKNHIGFKDCREEKNDAKLCDAELGEAKPLLHVERSRMTFTANGERQKLPLIFALFSSNP